MLDMQDPIRKTSSRGGLIELRARPSEQTGGGERVGVCVWTGAEAGSRWGAAVEAVGDRERVTCALVRNR